MCASPSVLKQLLTVVSPVGLLSRSPTASTASTAPRPRSLPRAGPGSRAVVVRCPCTQSFNPFATAGASSPRDAALCRYLCLLRPIALPLLLPPPTVNTVFLFSAPLRTASSSRGGLKSITLVVFVVANAVALSAVALCSSCCCSCGCCCCCCCFASTCGASNRFLSVCLSLPL